MSSGIDAEPVMNCAECGASILEIHLKRGLAGRWAGNILCPICLRERKQADMNTVEPESDLTGSSVMAGIVGGVSHDITNYRRPLNVTGKGATRVRTFHAKLSDGAIARMDQQINAWLDTQPDVEVKFASTAVGVWEGQHAEPSLVLTIFY